MSLEALSSSWCYFSDYALLFSKFQSLFVIDDLLRAPFECKHWTKNISRPSIVEDRLWCVKTLWSCCDYIFGTKHFYRFLPNDVLMMCVICLDGRNSRRSPCQIQPSALWVFGHRKVNKRWRGCHGPWFIMMNFAGWGGDIFTCSLGFWVIVSSSHFYFVSLLSHLSSFSFSDLFLSPPSVLIMCTSVLFFSPFLIPNHFLVYK